MTTVEPKPEFRHFSEEALLAAPCQVAPNKSCWLGSDFPWEWSVLVCLAAVEVPLAAYWGLSISLLRPGLYVYLLVFLAAAAIFRTIIPIRPVSLAADYLALIFFARAVSVVMTYIAAAPSHPLVDSKLMQADRWLGFDWQFWFQMMVAHPLARSVLIFLYNSVFIQSLLFAVLFSFLGRRDRLREIFWSIQIGFYITTAIFLIVPTLGPLSTFAFAHRPDINLYGADVYLKPLEEIRSRTNLHFSIEKMYGIIQFPSFHTTLAIIYSYCFRGTGEIGRSICLLNLGMLFAIPVCGGHYLVDMIAGAIIAPLSIGMARKALRSI